MVTNYYPVKLYRQYGEPAHKACEGKKDTKTEYNRLQLQSPDLIYTTNTKQPNIINNLLSSSTLIMIEYT